MHNSKGLTLMEVLVTVSILTLVFGMTFGAMRIYDISISMGSTKSNLSAQATQALNKMKEELAKSSHSVITGLNLALSFATESIPGNVTQIFFRVPNSVDSQQNIIWGDGQIGDYQLRYYVGNVSKANQLVRERHYASGLSLSPPEREVLANDITYVLFTYYGGNSLNITVTASKTAQRGVVPALSVTLSTRVDFKN